jgi:SMI1-KNR4 cell-wall
MESYISNRVIEANPFGTASQADLEEFEELAEVNLPMDYRYYLLEFNGGKFLNKCFERASGIDGRVHNIYGLHSGPKYASLNKNWKLSECYDIGESAPEVNNYIVFADTGTGDLLLLSKQSGAIYFLDHETIEYKQNEWVAERINPILLSDSFHEFVESLKPD